jgi:hypothetical protein
VYIETRKAGGKLTPYLRPHLARGVTLEMT